jgi:hypothetical protein
MTVFTDNWQPCTGATGFQDLEVTELSVVSLTRPTSPLIGNACTISVEADSTSTDKLRVVRYTLNQQDPDTDLGQALGDNDFLELRNSEQVRNFRVIGLEAGKTHKLKIQYFNVQ